MLSRKAEGLKKGAVLLVANADHKFLDVHNVRAICLARLADELLGEISPTTSEFEIWEREQPTTTFYLENAPQQSRDWMVQGRKS